MKQNKKHFKKLWDKSGKKKKKQIDSLFKTRDLWTCIIYLFMFFKASEYKISPTSVVEFK